MAEVKSMCRERLRWGQMVCSAFEEIGLASLMLIPRRWCMGWVRRWIAQHAYSCEESEVFLYKSGRAALHGLMEGLKISSPDRRTAYVPDYVCNVVSQACRTAGFEVVEYPTNTQCLPAWEQLAEQVRQDAAPVVVLCSLFGSVPACELQAVTLEQVNPKIFIVADECQNLVPNSPVKPRENRAVVFSFNDKTCPGLMGGGVVCPTDSDVVPVFERGILSRRILCSIALLYRWMSRMLQNTIQTARLACGLGKGYEIPDALEYSTCLRPQYDLVAEPIYRLSAARAWISLRFLETYCRIRMENELSLRKGMKMEGSVSPSGPPFMPILSGEHPSASLFPAPIKPAYGRTAFQVAAPDHGMALKINVPHVRYEFNEPAVAQLTSRHAITDNRILHCMARTADAYGYRSIILGPAKEDAVFGAIRLKACPVLKDGRCPPHFWLLIKLFMGAMRSGVRVFQIHDPDFLPVALLLKLSGRRIIYDVHDDYEASFRERFRNRRVLGAWVPSLWWTFEKTAARTFDGVVTADQHLAEKFKSCRPVILRNYPRLDFTPMAQPDGELTFNLIYVGGVSRERGVGMALQALQMLPMPEVRLHVVGTGWEPDLIEKLKSEPRVVLHGRVPWDDLHTYYTKAHAGLALYQPLAGFVTVDHSVKIVEYMAAGLPVLCSNFPGLKKFVEDSGCGWTVPPDDPEVIADKIRQWIEHPEIRRQLGEKGRQLFESEYNWEKHEHRLVELYQRILGTGAMA